jgi:hypothetical protein
MQAVISFTNLYGHVYFHTGAKPPCKYGNAILLSLLLFAHAQGYITPAQVR